HSGFYDFYWAYIFKTTNGGTNWVTLYNLGSSSWQINSILPLDESNIYITGEGIQGLWVTTGGVFKSTNGGLNFSLSLSNGQSNSVYFINTQTGWASTYYATDYGERDEFIYKTTNAGANWFEQHRDTTENGMIIRDIQFVNANTGYAISGTPNDRSRLYKTTNGGNYWDTTNYSNRKYEALFFINQNIGWKGGCAYPDSSCVAYTSNGGESWILQRRSVIARVYGLCFINNLTGWAAMWNGTIMKTTTGGSVSVLSLVNEIPSEYKLHQNYPNPFNPKTNIRFDLPHSSHVRLIIYDVLGREITTLVNEKLSAGSYEVDWNASGYPSGVYFYKLVADDYVGVKKMLMIK
ncbi:MAG: T9SS type A sorting domain-containing protein, partial [Bacteroidetes bacterium]|nr:T9SS type A sorting domain-containing protein [Bacteroidota bacterium]